MTHLLVLAPFVVEIAHGIKRALESLGIEQVARDHRSSSAFSRLAVDNDYIGRLGVQPFTHALAERINLIEFGRIVVLHGHELHFLKVFQVVIWLVASVIEMITIQK